MQSALGAMLGLAIFHGTIAAESYRVQLGNLPPAYLPDVWSYSAQIEIDAPPAKSRSALFPGKPQGRSASPPIGVLRELAAVRLLPPAPPAPPRNQVSPDVFLQPTKAPPSKEFLERIAKYYRISKPAEQEALWKWYQSEPSTLKDPDRLDNAYIRYTMAGGGRPPLNQAASAGKVNAPFPLSLRTTPFGPQTGTLQSGGALTIVPPPEGAWYRVETPEGTRWVCGFWVEAK